MTVCQYCIVQHNTITAVDKDLVHCGAYCGICGGDMIALEGIDLFVDVGGLAAHKVSQLCIVTTHAWITMR
jgi:hypothetical protein